MRTHDPFHDYLDDMLSAAQLRMDAAGIPRVVSIPCPYCERGQVLRNGRAERCAMCAGAGKTSVEATP